MILAVASAMLYQLSYRKAFDLISLQSQFLLPFRAWQALPILCFLNNQSLWVFIYYQSTRYTESCSYVVVVVVVLPVVLLSPPGLEVAPLEFCKERMEQLSLPIYFEAPLWKYNNSVDLTQFLTENIYVPLTFDNQKLLLNALSYM